MSPKIKAIIAVVIVTAVLFLLWQEYYAFLNQGRSAPESAQILNKIEKEGVPEFSLKDLQGREITAVQFNGKVVIINFWASWCEPCVTEFPSLIKLIAKYKGDIVLLAISADYEESDIRSFLKAFHVNDPNFIVMWDKDQAVAKKFGTFRLPESYLLGKDGKLIRKVSGIDDWATPDAFAFFDDLIKK